MRKFLSFIHKTLILSLACLSYSFAHADVNYAGGDVDSCGEQNGVIPQFVPAPVNGRDSRFLRCYADLDALKISIYRIAICREEPDSDDPSLDWSSKCVFIVNQSTPVEVEINNTSLIGIDEYVDLSGLTEGTYTHAALLIGNVLQTKMKKTFGQTLSGQTDTGTLCYSIDGAVYADNAPERSELTVECVNSEAVMLANANYGFASKEQDYWGNADTKKVAVSDGAAVHLMLNADTLATVNNAGRTSNAEMLLGVKEFSTPATIDANTSSIDLGFQLTSMGQIRLSTADGGDSYCDSTNICVNAMRNFGIGFTFTVQ